MAVSFNEDAKASEDAGEIGNTSLHNLALGKVPILLVGVFLFEYVASYTTSLFRAITA